MSSQEPWSQVVRMGASGREPKTYDLAADEAERKRIAKYLDLAELGSLTAQVTVTPWFDGVQIDGVWKAELVQTCGVTLEPLPSQPAGDFLVRVVPQGSPHAPDPEAELVIDLEADDPPDVVESDTVDLAHYVVEHLALDIDPFPRKPGVEFEPPTPTAEISPFAALRRLKETDER